jgi:hypothetical protein
VREAQPQLRTEHPSWTVCGLLPGATQGSTPASPPYLAVQSARPEPVPK